MNQQDEDSVGKLKVRITATSCAESILFGYISDSSRNTRQMVVDACMTHYYPRAVMSDMNVADRDMVHAAINSVSQLRAQIYMIIMEAEMRGLDLPASIYGSDTPIKPTKAKSEKKPAKPKSSPKPKVVEDDDEDWAEDDPRWGNDDDIFIPAPPMIIDLTD